MRLDDDLLYPTEAAQPPAIAAGGHADAGLRAGAARAAAAPALAEPSFDAAAALRREGELLTELRAVKGLIEERFGVLAFMEKLQRRPAEARLSQKLLDCGFSPILVRKMADGFKAEAGDETEWAAQILEQNLLTAGAGAGDRGPRRRVRARRRRPASARRRPRPRSPPPSPPATAPPTSA